MSRRPDPESCWAVDQVMRYESVNVKESAGLDPAALSPANPREKWLRKRTQVKLLGITVLLRVLTGEYRSQHRQLGRKPTPRNLVCICAVLSRFGCCLTLCDPTRLGEVS